MISVLGSPIGKVSTHLVKVSATTKMVVLLVLVFE